MDDGFAGTPNPATGTDKEGRRPEPSPESASNVIPWRPRARGGRPPFRRTPRLLTCSLELHDAVRSLNAFVAMVTDDEAGFRRRVAERYGLGAFGRALLGAGDQWHDAVSDMLVSDMVADMLATAAADPAGEISHGFAVALEVGFLN